VRIAALICLILISIVDGLLAYMLVLLSEMVFGRQPGFGGAATAVAEWSIALALCIAMPIAGFMLWFYRRAGIGIAIAAFPIVGEIFILLAS
jgi:hypothetical protein